MQWIKVSDEMPPDKWIGLVLTDVRLDKPVFAHRPDKWYRTEFPYCDPFSGRWREAILTGDHRRKSATVVYWLKVLGELYPTPPKEGDV